ncbi:biliverdin-producing heme oxygenase [Oricola sp.]|uniref:biliverdin-producing heme oxygenase n=1 Tax=Oricola sp. TaxID=1979950 RepID=UPI0025F63C2C|nr:biliverdin-producing heme oxygenase [Oricola sp.]MCI5074047.1 biliverdin-producing heme oxygenase [Oricola sp.]
MEAIEVDRQSADLTRVKRFKAETHSAHERLDNAIMAREPFSSRERYAGFLRVQYLFHRDIDALYRHPVLKSVLPDLDGRRRMSLVAQDLTDLGAAVPVSPARPAFDLDEPADIPTALGWLYVAEGSNLGAAFLLKAAAKLGLSETFGARHLAGAPEGRGLHWRTFTSALDEYPLDPDGDERAVAGAVAAFARVSDYVRLAYDG